MKKILVLAVSLLSLSVEIKADANAALQMRLAKDAAFQQRVSYILMQEAFVVLAENPATSNHANRFQFALNVRNNINSVIQNGYVTALVGRTNLVSETTTCSGNPEVCTTTATDAEIASQIATDWNLWSNNQ